MYLKSLTLRGFKSFASATTLAFEPGVTCVVGPNGSGKSNVVDALSWVMGEQGAKSLRGGKMEDVIFAGTAGRPPLGRAEVALTIDNTDGALPIEYTEVTISRTMFRNGGSEYAINNHPARLLDVQELLSDSGIGREMHVIVGQGQLDTILQATPEVRRGFIEEAAGVLKHRKRKEKALRKLDATEGNLNRLNDLIGEIHRQLKPLGRQAEVARKAAVIQAEVRDAKARLIADDLIQATLALESDLADEAALKAERARVEKALDDARAAEQEADDALRGAHARLQRAQETWYALAALGERVGSTLTIAAERMRHADELPLDEPRGGRDPETLEREAAQMREQEEGLRREVETLAHGLDDATLRRNSAEAAHAEEEKRYNAQLRAAADRREGLARLTGQVNSLRSRAGAAADEIGRLEAAEASARQRAEQATRQFTSLESTLAGLDAGEEGLDAAYEEAVAAQEEADADLAVLREQEQAAQNARAGINARLDGLRLGLDRKDASAALLAGDSGLDGLLGSVATLIEVEPRWRSAVSTALNGAAEAVAVSGIDEALHAFARLKADDLGRAGLVLAGAAAADEAWPELPSFARYAIDVVCADDDLRPALARLLRKVALVDDLPAARTLIGELPDVMAVTVDGDVLSAWYSAGGSSAKPSLIEVQAAVEEAEQQLSDAHHEVERLRFAVSESTQRQTAAADTVAAALARLHESDAQLAGIAEELGHLRNAARNASGEADRLRTAVQQAAEARDRDLAGLADLEDRLARASTVEDEGEPDPAERDRLGVEARAARQAEMDARLALRTAEERMRALAGRADSLRRAAVQERDARAKAAARREHVRREGERARAVHQAGSWLIAQVNASRDRAGAERAAAESLRAESEAALGHVRAHGRELAKQFESLVDSVHRDEMARAEQRMRIEALGERALTELGLEPETLMDEYGPDRMVPVLTRPDGTALTADDEEPEPIPFVRDEQARRLRAAERNLAVLGRVNPLALEEFDAMQERHTFLAEQLDDLRKTRKDLLELIEEVDERVQQVFAAAYADVEAAFERVFARLFPGGEGRLVLTEPGQWLTTGVDVEARPPGKKIKRLSLLSGGERSLVAVAFLVSLFIARPSPFYILDEVEAALDDTNLGRLLDIYNELRENSQLLVITHQKRTMEIADALYGVTMRGDGVSTVISQRLREET